MSDDLWPDDLTENIPRTPATVLSEQATALAKRTNGIIQADIDVTSDRWSESLDVALVLKVPSLDGYTYRLLSLTHKQDLYPVKLGEQNINDEQELIDALRREFRDDRTKRIVRALIAQAYAKDKRLVEALKKAEDDDIPF